MREGGAFGGAPEEVLVATAGAKLAARVLWGEHSRASLRKVAPEEVFALTKRPALRFSPERNVIARASLFPR